MDLNHIVEVVVATAPVWGPFAVALTHWLLGKLPARQRDTAVQVVSHTVQAVEQMYKAWPGSGEQKKAEVERLVGIELARLGVKLDPATLNVLIEAAVGSLAAAPEPRPAPHP